jgi:hypothetical protein
MSGNWEVSWSMWAFHLQTSYDSLYLLLIQNWKSICNQTPFALYFHPCFHFSYEIIDFVNLQFSFICISLVMKNGPTFPFAILPKLSITFGCNSWENTTLVCTQQHLTTTFMLSNSLHYIDSTCKVVQSIMVLIGMNCCWKGLTSQMNLARLVTIVTNYMFGYSFTKRLHT